MSLGPSENTGSTARIGPVFPDGLGCGLLSAVMALCACAAPSSRQTPPLPSKAAAPVESKTPAASSLEVRLEPSEVAPVLSSSGTFAGQAPGGPLEPAAVAVSSEPAPAPVVLPTSPVPVPEDANFVLTTFEAIAGSEGDVLSQTRVFMDGKPLGETHIGPKSKEKRWGMRLEPGNHLFRFEQWVFTPPATWAPLAAEWQPRERFVRVEKANRAAVTLKFQEDDRGYSLLFIREEP